MKQKTAQAKEFTHRHPLISGTLLLTVTGFLSRIIGFFYRIYLSRLFGEEGMGIYQLIHPVSALAFSLTGAAFQTAISKFVAGQTDQSDSPAQKSYRPLILGTALSLPLSLVIGLLLYHYAEPVALFWLAEERTAPLLRLLAFTVPFSALHACINGYFYGIQKASVPAWTQFLEQIFRVGSVFLLAAFMETAGKTPDLSLAVLGLILGECAGLLGAILVLCRKIRSEKALHTTYITSDFTLSMLLSMVLPLAANRVVLNLLQSLEAVSLPAGLRAYGYDQSTALSIYGVLTGMALPLIFFPNALTGSVSVLLLPAISENMAKGKHIQVRKTILQTIQFCSVLGFACMGFFLFFGRTIGRHIFQSELAGFYICELSFLCPFLYLNSTLSGVLQGLGKAGGLFVSNVVSLLLRLAFIYLAIPSLGMQGYLWGVLLSQILLTFLYLSMMFFRKNLHHFAERSKLTQ